MVIIIDLKMVEIEKLVTNTRQRKKNHRIIILKLIKYQVQYVRLVLLIVVLLTLPLINYITFINKCYAIYILISVFC